MLQTLFNIVYRDLGNIWHIDKGHLLVSVARDPHHRCGTFILILPKRRDAIIYVHQEIVQIGLQLILEIDDRDDIFFGYIPKQRHHLKQMVVDVL